MALDSDPRGPEPQRSEVYERIPWEHLEKQAGDRQWLYVGVAGAVALGVLAYSFVKNQPVQPEADPLVVTTEVASLQPLEQGSQTPEPSVSSPVVVSEADLYAVDHERLAATAVAHAEWFAVEYFSVDGSEVSNEILHRLLPIGVPLPESPEGIQVFVDWVGTRRVAEIDALEFEIDVLVRSLLSTESSGFVRQPVRMLRVRVRIGDDGEPQLSTAPLVVEAPPITSARMDLAEVPSEVAAQTEPGNIVVGGVPMGEGGWQLVVMAVGVDGVKRPQLLEIP